MRAFRITNALLETKKAFKIKKFSKSGKNYIFKKKLKNFYRNLKFYFHKNEDKVGMKQKTTNKPKQLLLHLFVLFVARFLRDVA